MPGIAGIISKMPQKENERDLRLMIDCMMHEPFYTSGTYVNEKLGLYAGWVCHRDSFSDCMPVVNEKRDLVLIFTGENFTDNDLTDRLRNQGHKFESSNASYLIHLYEEDEKRFLENLNGWFSGILVDLREGKVILFNDRYGMHRIYYSESENMFLFSSEAKSLLKIRHELRQINLESLGQFFACDCVLQNQTLFSNVFLLPGGSAWTFLNISNIKKDNYFKPGDWENQPTLGKETFYERLRETFLNILPHYFNEKKQIAMSLSSGLDTRVIMAYLGEISGELPSYTFSGMIRDSLDARIARKVADICNQMHHIVKLDGNFLSNFKKFAEKTVYVTDGCHDVCGSYDVYFNKFAREIAPIRMTGKFGSEILGSHSMLKKPLTLSDKLFHFGFKKYVDKAVQTFSDNKKGHELSFSVFKEIPWHEYGRVAIEMSKLTMRTPYMDNDLVKLMYQAPANTRASNNQIRLRLIEDCNPALGRIMTDRGTAGKNISVFSKAAQLFYYFLFKSEYMYLWELPHWLVKIDYILAPLHPERLMLGRYQLGYYRLWFRNELSDYVKEILLDRRTMSRPYLNKEFLGKMVTGHIKGERNYVNEINKTLTVEVIHRLLIENI